MKFLIDVDRLPDPVNEMKIRVSRRGVLQAAADAAEERLRTQQGFPSFRIEDLSAYDDNALGTVCPAVNRKAVISLEKGAVYAETSAAVDPIPLFPLSSPALFIFNQFNGMQPLSEIIAKTAEHTGWDEDKSRQIVRSVFLKLCEVRVCEPGNAE